MTTNDEQRDAFEAWFTKYTDDYIDNNDGLVPAIEYDAAFDMYKSIIAQDRQSRFEQGIAKKRYDEAMQESDEMDAVERLRFYCSCAMTGQDWLDAEPFFDDLIKDRQSRGEPVAYLDVSTGGYVDLWTDKREELVALPIGRYLLYKTPQPAEPVNDECAATGQGCSYGPYGPNGERQCQYCGESPAEPVKGPSALTDGQIDSIQKAWIADGGVSGSRGFARAIERALLASFGQPTQPAASAEPRWIGHIMLDAKGQPYARLRTGCDEHGNQWQDMTPFYAAHVAAQPSVPDQLPEHEEDESDSDCTTGHKEGYVQGWNDCCDAMLKGQK